MTSCTVTIVNPLGMHARAAARFVHTAGGFEARIKVARGSREVDGKSIMGLLLLSAAQGSMVTLTADGPDEADAMAALCGLVESGFGEAPCA
ncbi:HPr family phosphocarrier protein [soil metagenome]|nr:HPr family phosphocarrier protein [Acidobacteriota bacterium]